MWSISAERVTESSRHPGDPKVEKHELGTSGKRNKNLCGGKSEHKKTPFFCLFVKTVPP